MRQSSNICCAITTVLQICRWTGREARLPNYLSFAVEWNSPTCINLSGCDDEPDTPSWLGRYMYPVCGISNLQLGHTLVTLQSRTWSSRERMRKAAVSGVAMLVAPDMDDRRGSGSESAEP